MPISENQTKRDERLSLIQIIQEGSEEESLRAMDELLASNIGLVRSIVIRFRDRGVDFEDLMQIGFIGMMKAARSFELERGTAFSTYAVPLIMGEIRRHLRDEGPLKVSRVYKKMGMALMSAKSRIMQEEGREAHIEELAELCGLSKEEAAVALEASSPVVSLSEKVYSDKDGIELGMLLPDEDSANEIERMCDRIALGQAIRKMSLEWQKIVLLRYYRNLTQQQTAEVLGFSQVKISREEKKIMEFLRCEMLR